MVRPNLSVEFCGFLCENPFLLAASPAARTGEMIERAFEAGWGGAITKSVSLDQDLPDHSLSPRFAGIKSGGSQLQSMHGIIGMTNIDFRIDKSVRDTLEEYALVKKKYPNKFLGVSIKAEYKKEQWHKLAAMAAETGADALELCLSCPDAGNEEGCNVGAIGQNSGATSEVLTWVKEVTNLPVIVKLSPHITDITAVGKAAANSGAAALAAINTVKSISGYNLDTLEPIPTIEGMSTSAGLSGPAIKPLAMYCIYELRKDKFINLQLSAIGGVTCSQDAIEYILTGATTVQVATQVMHEGYGLIRDLKEGLERFMTLHGFEFVNQFVGIGTKKIVSSTKGLSRKQQLVSNIDPERCIGCGRCFVACRDGAYNAISFLKNREVKVDINKCVGCGLCSVVCPVTKSIFFTSNPQKWRD